MQQRAQSIAANGPDRFAGSEYAVILGVYSNGTLSVSLEAHGGLSGTTADRAGFLKLWLSKEPVASPLCHRDVNEALGIRLVYVVERIPDSTELPVLIDGDSGFAKLGNARLLKHRNAIIRARDTACNGNDETNLGLYLVQAGYQECAWRDPSVRVDAEINIDHYSHLATPVEGVAFHLVLPADSPSVVEHAAIARVSPE